MLTGRESLCCLEVPNTDPKMTTGQHCIVEGEEFQAVCTCMGVIKTAMVVFLADNGQIPDVPQHE